MLVFVFVFMFVLVLVLVLAMMMLRALLSEESLSFTGSKASDVSVHL